MADYQLTATSAAVIRTADQAYIPNDPHNKDWKDYQAWLAAGNTPDPYVPPPVMTPNVDRMQWLVQLEIVGQSNAWTAWVNRLTKQDQIRVNNAQSFIRHGGLIETAAAGIGWTSQQLDAWYTAALAINPIP